MPEEPKNPKQETKPEETDDTKQGEATESVYDKIIAKWDQDGRSEFITRFTFIGTVDESSDTNAIEAAGDIFPSESHGIIVGDQKIVVGVVESPTETYHEFPTALHGLMADCGPLKDVVVLGSIDDVRPAFFSAPVAAPATFHSSGATDITTTPLPALIVSVTADLLQFSKTVCSDPAALQSRISQQHHFLPAVETCTRIMDTPGPMRLGVWMDVYCTPLRLELASERAE